MRCLYIYQKDGYDVHGLDEHYHHFLSSINFLESLCMRADTAES